MFLKIFMGACLMSCVPLGAMQRVCPDFIAAQHQRNYAVPRQLITMCSVPENVSLIYYDVVVQKGIRNLLDWLCQNGYVCACGARDDLTLQKPVRIVIDCSGASDLSTIDEVSRLRSYNLSSVFTLYANEAIEIERSSK